MDYAARASRKGTSRYPRLEHAQAGLLIFCGLKSFSLVIEDADIEARSGASQTSSLANAHAELPKSCAPASPARILGMADFDIDVRSVACWQPSTAMTKPSWKGSAA